MNESGIKLTTYFGERERAQDKFLADALFDLYEQHRMRTSVLLRGTGGFGQHNRPQSDRLLTLSENLPAVSIAVDARERIEQAVGDVIELAGSGLITLERAQLIGGEALEQPPLPDTPGQMFKLTVYGGRAVRAAGQTGYVTAIELLRDAGAIGASVLLAVDGTLHGERRRARFFARNAQVPLMLLAIGDARAISTALPGVARLLQDPVATIERVQICKSDGVRLSDPPAVAERDPTGLPVWQKLMIHVEEQGKHDGHPLYLELVRRLHAVGAAGATVLRGVRGFYGERDPFADRMLSLRRNVPVVVVAIDSPSAVRRWWPVVDELTADAGLITSELVPGSHGLADASSSTRLASPPPPG